MKKLSQVSKIITKKLNQIRDFSKKDLVIFLIPLILASGFLVFKLVQINCQSLFAGSQSPDDYRDLLNFSGPLIEYDPDQKDCSLVTDPNLPQLSQEAKENLVKVAQLALGWKNEKQQPLKFSPQFKNLTNPVFVTLRSQGKQLSRASISSSNLQQSVYLATQKAARNINQEASLVNIEISLIGKEASDNHLTNFKAGIHGIKVKDNTREITLLAKETIEKNLSDAKILRPSLCQTLGRNEFCYHSERPDEPRFTIFENLEFGTTYLTGSKVLTFHRASQSHCSEPFDKEAFDEMVTQGENWLAHNISSTGQLNYSYYPATDQYSTEQMAVRQLLTAAALARAADYNPQHQLYQTAHKRNLSFLIYNWYCQDETLEHGYACYQGVSDLGSNAAFLRTLVYSPHFENHQERAQAIAQAITSLQNPDGSFQAFYKRPPSGDYDEDVMLTYYSGEAINALTEYYKKTNQEKYLRVAKKAQDFYLEKYVNQIDQNFSYPYVPWHSQSLFRLYRITQDNRYLEAILTLNDRLIKIQNIDSGPYFDLQGRFSSSEDPRLAHASADGVYTEGLIYAYQAAVILEDQTRQTEYKKRILLSLQNLRRLQYQEGDLYYLAPENLSKAQGALKKNIADTRLRLDNVQHLLDALYVGQIYLPNFQ